MDYFNVRDARQVAALLVFMEYPRDEIVDVLERRFGLDHYKASELTSALMRAHLDAVDKSEAVRKAHLAAVASEWDISKTMHTEGD